MNVNGLMALSTKKEAQTEPVFKSVVCLFFGYFGVLLLLESEFLLYFELFCKDNLVSLFRGLNLGGTYFK